MVINQKYMLPTSVQNLIDEFSKLPGIGPKSAARLVFFLLTRPPHDIENLGNSVTNLLKSLKYCTRCYNITEDSLCLVCGDEKRNQQIVAVVEEPLDVIALEKSGVFDGLYHVLGGAVSPINGIGPDELRIKQLFDRIENEEIKEIILATNPNLEGEATASYIREKIHESHPQLSITRIARGLPIGGDLEYADEVTLRRSLEGRREY